MKLCKVEQFNLQYLESAVTETNTSSQEPDSGSLALSQSTPNQPELGGKKSFDYKTFNQNDIFEEILSKEKESNLLIPEINFEAATPKVESPCLSPKPEAEETFFPEKKEFVLKFNEDSSLLTKQEMDRVLGVNGQDSDITEEDWDRMETLAEEERLSLDGEQNENRIKLNKFRENPKVDISKSRLADELKLILEEAKKRIEENNFPDAKLNKINKKGRKKQKEVTFANKKSIFNKNVGKLYDVTEDEDIMEALMKVEKEQSADNLEQAADVSVDDSSLLNGFMEGFEEESCEDISAPEETNHSTLVTKCIVVTSALLLCGVGYVIFLHRLRQ